MAPELFRNQNYKLLKKELIKDSRLFTDVEFSPSNTSIYFEQSALGENVEWKRPGDMVKNPRLFVEGISYNDVTQGILGNCWFVAACAALTRHKTLWSKVIPEALEQEWDKNKPERYCGIFHFCFWRFGQWVDVVIDDLLPTRNGELIFARSTTLNEFWTFMQIQAHKEFELHALKFNDWNYYPQKLRDRQLYTIQDMNFILLRLNGSYESLAGGTLTEAFVDITGGVPETIALKSNHYVENQTARSELFQYLKEACDLKALIAAAIVAKTPEEVEQQLDCGLVKGHSYAISAVKRLALDANHTSLMSQLFSKPEKIMMVRLQNPWGEKEWNGPWSDGSSEWQLISKHQQQELGLKIEEDGQFWMTWEDFCTYFTDVSVCHQINTSFFTLGKRYIETIFQGIWMNSESRGDLSDRAGGCANFKESCLCNPQYRIDVSDDDSEIIVSLMQRDIRERRRQGVSYLTIGIMVERVEENRTFRMHQLLDMQATSDYISTRSVYLRMVGIRRGRYVVIPTTYAPGEEGEFMMRVYSAQQLNASELTQDKPSVGLLPFCRKQFTCVTRLRLIGGEQIMAANSQNADSYCIVVCENFNYRTLICRSTNNPKWDILLIFLRKSADKPITIDVWDANILKDSFLGRAVIRCPVSNDVKTETIQLGSKKKSNDSTADKVFGSLKVEVVTYNNPIYL